SVQRARRKVRKGASRTGAIGARPAASGGSMMRYIVGRRSLGTPAEQDRIGEAASATADEGARLVEPARLLASDPALSSTMRGLLQSPPPVKPLDAPVAMRLRGAVLQSPNGPVGPTKAASGPSTQPAALAKLGAIAGGAAL